LTLRNGLGLLAALLVAALCVRLGFWQLARLEAKRAANRELRAAQAAPVLDLEPVPRTPAALTLDSLLHRRARVGGRYDFSRQILLRGRAHDGVPGVQVVTPLRLAGRDDAVLVRRGWLPAPDATTARPRDYPEPETALVVGVAEPLPALRPGERVFRLSGSGEDLLLSARELALDSLRAWFPYPLLSFALRQLPDSGLSARPLRLPPSPLAEGMHLSYAVQWFSFAGIIAVGSLVLAFRGRRERDRPTNPIARR
jgi:surfeit locus 1 family protein